MGQLGGFTTQFGYDSEGNLSSIQKPLDPSPVLITYDQTFDVPTEIIPLTGAPILSILNETTGYDSFGNPISFSNGLGTYSNQTDSNGLLISVYDLRNPQTRTYDTRGRLITIAFKSGRTLTYTWDNFDRVTKSRLILRM